MIRHTLTLAVLLGTAACGTTVPLSTQHSGLASASVSGGGGAAGQGRVTGPGGSLSVPGPHPAAAAASSGQQAGYPTTIATAAVPGPATSVTSPIKVGVVDLAPGGAAATALGVTSSDRTSATEATQALVRALNAQGGLAGRKIVLVEHTVDVMSNDYETELQAACDGFVHDSKVDIVVSNTNSGFYESFERCLANAGMPHLASFGAGAADEASYTAYPELFSTGAPSIERRITAVLTGLAQRGFLSHDHPLGVIVEGCDYNQRAYDHAFTPLATQLGLVVTRRVIDCAHGFSDAATLTSQVSGAVLPFRSAGVDRVMILSQFEGIALRSFTSAAESQRYRPGYALSSTALITQLAASIQPAQLLGMVGIGWQPDTDVTEHVLASSATARCRQLLKGQGVQLASKADDQTVDLTCAPFFLLQDLLRLTRGASRAQALLGALGALGRTFVSPLDRGGETSYADGRRDGTVAFAPFGYLASCGCFRYQ